MELNYAKRISIRLLCFFISFFTVSSVFGASDIKEQTSKKNISIDVNNANITSVFTRISQLTGYKFFYDENVLKGSSTVTLKLNNESIDKVLSEISRQTDLSFKQIDNTISVNKSNSKKVTTNEAVKQSLKITGVVRDDKGETMPGVNVTIKGSTIGVVTDLDGKYSLSVPSQESVLIFSFIGYLSEEVTVGAQNAIDLSMFPNIQSLNEVVVIGYGESKKKDLSTAIATFDVSKQKSNPTDAVGMMQGRLAGVTVSNDGGDPLSKAKIVVRGRGSRYQDETLYIVDGIPGAPFNTEDVESISILKDAASAAIYGAHVGSGGVFIVTTKKAQVGKAKISANAYHGWQSASNIPQSLTAEEYNKVSTDAALAGNGKIPDVVSATIYPYGQTTRTNWMNEIFRVGKIDHYAVSITGGSEQLKAIASFEYNNKEGILLNTFAKNLGGKIDVEYKINDKFTFNQTGRFDYSNGQGDINTSSHTGVTTAAMFMPSSAPVYDENGSYCGTVPAKYSDLGIAGQYGEVQNPVATLNRLDQNRPEQILFSTSALSYKPVDFLTLKSSFSVRNKQARYEDFVSKVPEIGKSNLTNSRSMQSSWANSWLWENTANFSKVIEEKHSISALVGYSQGYENYRYFGLSAYGFADESPFTRSLVNATDWSKDKPSELFWEESQLSSFGRVAYSFDDRYFATASCRYDATSKLPTANNSGVFPAVSAAWKISSEPFFANKIEAISLFKLRASWGQIGNVAAVPKYAGSVSLASDASITYLGNTGQTKVSGVGLTTIPNPNLKWETSEQTDFGADLGFFNDKLNITADYFIKNTIDMIDWLPLPSVAGVSEPPYANIGDTKNSGIELTIEYHNKIGDLGYSIGGNYTNQKNEVTSIGNQTNIADGTQIRGVRMLSSAVGQAWNSFYLIQTDGLFQDQAEIDKYTLNGKLIQPNAKPGDIKFKDVSGPDGKPDGQITELDRVYCGSYSPTQIYGFNLNLDYKGFDFGIQFQGVAGNKIFNGFKLMTMEGIQGWNMSKDILDSWTYNKSSDIARVTNSDANKNYGTASDYFLEDGSYLRLKSITFGYTLPKSILSKIKCEGTTFRVYCSGENLATWTKYKGIDPEVGNNGVDGGRYPVARIVNVGLNIGF